MTSNNTSTISLEDLSIKTIRSLLIPQLLYLIFGTVNLISALLCSIVLFRHRKKFSGRTFSFLRLFFVQDCFLTLYMLIFNSLWHLYNNLFSRAEIFPRYVCFRFTGVLFCMVINNSLLTFLISIDRLRITLRPKSGNVKFNWTFCTIIMLIGPSIISCVLYIVSLFDNADSSTAFVVYCTTRSSTGPKMTLILWYMLTISSYATLLVYLIMLLFTWFKSIKVFNSKSTRQRSKAVKAINARMTNKLSKLLAYTTIAYFLIGPLPNTISALLALFFSTDAFLFGSYIGWMTFTESTVYTVSLLFLGQFRREFLSMFCRMERSSRNVPRVRTSQKDKFSNHIEMSNTLM